MAFWGGCRRTAPDCWANLHFFSSSLFLEWAAADTQRAINWSNGINDGVAFHKFTLTQNTVFAEASDQALWGNWYYGTSADTGVSGFSAFYCVTLLMAT